MANVLHTSVAGPDAALGHIRDFINSTLTGWTIHQNLAAPGAGQNAAGGRILTASKGDVLLGLRSTTTGTSSGNLFLFDGVPPWVSAVNLDSLPGNSGIRVTDAQYDDVAHDARFWNEVGGTWPRLWIFGADSPSFVHVVAEISSEVFYHMSFGELLKVGTWTGGAYYAAQFWARTGGVGGGANGIDDPEGGGHNTIFDARATSNRGRWTTLHCATTSPTSSWVELSGASADFVFNSVQRRFGHTGPVRGDWGAEFVAQPPSPLSGQVQFHQISAWFRNIAPTPDEVHLLGYVPEVRSVNVQNIQPAQDVTIGGNTWRCFPVSRRNGVDGSFNSGFFGLAYRVF